MNQENPGVSSPFSALSYQEQQDRWLEWRSRQLDYRPAASSASASPAPEAQTPADIPPLRLPNFPSPAPTRHRELDQVWARHRQASRQAGVFQPVTKKD